MALKDVSKLNIDEIIECLKIYNETGESQMDGNILGRIAELWNEIDVQINVGYNNKLSIEQLKKQIKYSKNPLEIKMLNKKLNKVYKDIKSR